MSNRCPPCLDDDSPCASPKVTGACNCDELARRLLLLEQRVGKLTLRVKTSELQIVALKAKDVQLEALIAALTARVTALEENPSGGDQWDIVELEPLDSLTPNDPRGEAPAIHVSAGDNIYIKLDTVWIKLSGASDWIYS